MPNEPSILCPVDFLPASELGLERARELASAFGQPIELLHVYQLPYMPELPGLGKDMSSEGMQWIRTRGTELLEERKRKLEQAGVKVTLRLEEGSAARVIAQRAQSPEISAVVMGTHGRGFLGRAFLGSVAERVLRTALVPVMTVRAEVDSQPTAAPRPLKRSLVAYDFSEPARRALEFAFELARRNGGHVDVVHVHPEHYVGDQEPHLGVPWPTPEQSERYMRFLEHELEQLVPAELKERTRCLVYDGDPKQLLIAKAEEWESDLLCIGATGKDGVERVLLGSVSQALVRRSPIPVLTAP